MRTTSPSGSERCGAVRDHFATKPLRRSCKLDRPCPPLVHQLGDEGADVGVQAPGLLEEDAARGVDGLPLPQQVLEDRERGALGVRRRRHLRQLLGVAEQDYVARRDAERQRVGQGDLARLVDEEVVQRLGVLAALEPFVPQRSEVPSLMLIPLTSQQLNLSPLIRGSRELRLLLP